MSPRTFHGHVDSAADLGRRLREARLAAGLSQRELAFQGCVAAYLSRIESGERVPSLQLIHELAWRLGVSSEWLARGDGEPASPPSATSAPTLGQRVRAVEFARLRYERARSARKRRVRTTSESSSSFSEH